MQNSPKPPPLLSRPYTLLSHISLPIRSYTRSKPFYNALMSTIAAECVYDNPDTKVLGYGPSHNPNLEALTLSQVDHVSPSGQGVHCAFNAPDRRSVREFWEVAIREGGSDEGKWGLREHYGTFYYAAFVRDLDGNKLEVVYQEDDGGEEREEGRLRRELIQIWDIRADRERRARVNGLRGMDLKELQEEVLKARDS